MAGRDELIKFITQRVVTYMDTPREVRKQSKQSVKVKRGRWDVRWFGMLPLALAMWSNGIRSILQRLRLNRKK